MSVHVDVERCVPHVLGGAEVGADAHAGVGPEQVDWSERSDCIVDQLHVALFAGHVGGDANA